MRSEHVAQLVRLYSLAVKMAWIVVGASLLAILLQSCNFFAPGSACNPFGGALPVVAYLTLVTGVLALFGMSWALKKARRVLDLIDQDEAKAASAYAQLWNFQTNAGALVTTGAVIMIPLAIPALMMGLAGAIAVFAVFGGAWLHLRARRINREITVAIAAGENEVADSIAQNEKGAGIGPLVVAAAMLLTNLIIEISFTNDLRAIPTFFNAQSTTNASVSMTMGFSTFLDIFVFGSVGLTMLIYAIVIRKRMPRRRLWVIAGLTIAQLLIVQGTIAPMLARALGPSAAGANLRSQMNDAAETMRWMQTIALPDGFKSIEQSASQEEINVRWLVQSTPLEVASFDLICSSVIAYATELGATAWVEKTGSSKGSVSDAEETRFACLKALEGYPKLKVQRHPVTSPDFILAGKAAGGTGSPIAIKVNLLKQGTSTDFPHPNTWIYELTIYTTYNEDALTLEGGLSKGTIEFADLLTLISQERLAAPDRNPTDPAFVREMLKSYKHDIKIEVFESKPGVADRLDVTNSEGTHVCLAIDPWDAEREGVEDPGVSYGLGFMQDLKVLKGFGYAVDGGCK